MGGGDTFIPKKPDKSPLLVRLGAEALCGTLSAIAVAPAITIIDKAIVANASGVEALLPGIINGFKSLFRNPIAYVRQPSFLFICGVYSGTYITSNCIEAACQRSSKSSFFPKLIGASGMNVTLSILKDQTFARMFGKGPPRSLPPMSIALFGMRDSLTILAGFSLPGLLSIQLQESGWRKHSSETFSQILTPVFMQIFSTPFYLVGLDLYNRTGVSTAERVDFVQKEYTKTTIARMSRILPAYGIGGVVNTQLRRVVDGAVIDRYDTRDHCDTTAGIGLPVPSFVFMPLLDAPGFTYN